MIVSFSISFFVYLFCFFIHGIRFIIEAWGEKEMELPGGMERNADIQRGTETETDSQRQRDRVRVRK